MQREVSLGDSLLPKLSIHQKGLSAKHILILTTLSTFTIITLVQIHSNSCLQLYKRLPGSQVKSPQWSPMLFRLIRISPRCLSCSPILRLTSSLCLNQDLWTGYTIIQVFMQIIPKLNSRLYLSITSLKEVAPGCL